MKKQTLETLRVEIDACDRELMKLFKKRFSIAKKIGKLKSKQGLSIRDAKREKKVIEDRTEKGEKYNLSFAFIRSIWLTLFKESYTHQK